MTCGLQAIPSSIIIPGTSTLFYDCEAIPSSYACTLSDQNNNGHAVSRNGESVKGSDSITPTAAMTYTILCTDQSGNNGPQASATAQVSVTNPGQGECPPQGCTP